MIIFSVVVKTKVEDKETLMNALKESQLCEVHFSDDSQIIVTIEGEELSEVTNKWESIKKMKNVLSASMVNSYEEALPL